MWAQSLVPRPLPGLSPREREIEDLGVYLHVGWGSLVLGQLPDFLQKNLTKLPAHLLETSSTAHRLP